MSREKAIEQAIELIEKKANLAEPISNIHPHIYEALVILKNLLESEPPGELKYCKEHRTIHCSCQQREIDRLESENTQLRDGYKVKCDEYNALKLQYDALYSSMAWYDKSQLEELIVQLKAELDAKDEVLKAWRKYMTLRNEGKLSETIQIEKVNAYEKACQLTEQSLKGER